MRATSLIKQCGYTTVNLTMRSVGLAAESGRKLKYVVASNSITGNALVTVTYSVSAAASPHHSLVALGPQGNGTITAGETHTFRVRLYDSEGLPISNTAGTDVLEVEMQKNGTTVTGSTCVSALSTAEGHKYFEVSLRLLSGKCSLCFVRCTSQAQPTTVEKATQSTRKGQYYS
jgi:hypothetical protein